jgi:hypothetical protein
MNTTASPSASDAMFLGPPEVWDAAKCRRMAVRVARDGMGTPYPFAGAVPELPTTVRYNGGCVEGDSWYAGRQHTRPQLADGFRLEQVSGWCWRIVSVSITS